MSYVSFFKAVNYTFETNSQALAAGQRKWQLASAIDYIFSVSLFDSQKATFYQNRFVFSKVGDKTCRVSMPLLLIKIVALSILFVKSGKLAALLTIAGIATKWTMRHGARIDFIYQAKVKRAKKVLEELTQSSNPQSPYNNLRTWLKRMQNQSDLLLALLGKSYKELKALEGPENLPINAIDRMIKIKIKGEAQEYSESFLRRIPFFNGLLDFWIGEQNSEVNLGDSFPVSHEALREVSQVFEQGSSWNTQHLEEMGFLGLVNDYLAPEQKNFVQLQEMLRQDDTQLGQWLQTNPRFQAMNQERTLAKSPEFSFNFFPIPDCPEMNEQAIISYLNKVQEASYEPCQKHYLFNVVLDKYLNEKKDNERLGALESLVQSESFSGEWVTVLRLHFDENEQLRACSILKMFPHLRWLELSMASLNEPWILADNFPKLGHVITLNLQMGNITPVEAAAIAEQCSGRDSLSVEGLR